MSANDWGQQPLIKTNVERIRSHLLALGLSQGMNVAIHSKLLCFGRIEGGIGTLYKAIREIVGENATIIVPAYTLNIASDGMFNPEVTEPQSMGGLSNYLFNKGKFCRTLNPLHSHFIDGPLRKRMMNADQNISMGPGSIFQVMQDEGFKLLLLGCSFQEGATFIHHIEACKGVPYREWINLKRTVTLPNQTPKEVNIRYYARRQNCGLQTNLDAIQDKLLTLNALRKVRFNFCDSYFMDMLELVNAVEKLMVANHNILMVEKI